MNASRRWLEAFLRRPLDTKELVERLAMLGAPVDVVEPLHHDLASIRVALVEGVVPHPNADRLRVCTVNDGSAERRSVVCGAPNVEEGKKYPFAPVGATLPGGLTIEKRKLRGELSEGMLCSARELGLGQDAAGLWELATDAAPGTPLIDAIPLVDERLVVDVTPNRPDLLGHKGLARELAASYGVPFRLPEIPSPGTLAERVAMQFEIPPVRRVVVGTDVVGGIRVGSEDPEGCPRFAAAVIRGVKVGPSPEWLKRRLEAVGVRSISNIVDATNYVMFELCQPLHAYDAATLKGATVVARRAKAGEKLVTLDGVERTLDGETTAIADAGGVIGIGGVMGGASTEVSEKTQDILLECAYFAPSRVRRTRRALNLSTEASYRFERGVDRWAGADALRRCIELVLATAGGTLEGAPVDCWAEQVHPPRIFVRLARVAQVLGVQLPLHTVEKQLVAIGATVVAKPDDARVAVDVPGWRPDLTTEIDLIEEIARVHGYGAFPVELRPFRVPTRLDAPIDVAVRQVRRGMVERGLFEAVTLPLVAATGAPEVTLLNPLAATESVLRPALLPSLARQVEGNWAARVRDVRLFEIGTAFAPGDPGQRPVEEMRVAGVITGAREPRHWSEAAGATGADVDRWDVKGLLEAAVALAIPDGSVQVEGTAWIVRDGTGKVRGGAGPVAADAPPWAAPVYGFEVVIDPAPRRPPRFRPLPSTPSSERVFALVVPDGTSAERIVRELAGAHPLLEAVEVESEFRGAGLADGTRSLALRLTFRAADRTLTDADVDAAEAALLDRLRQTLGLARRGVASGAPAPAGG